MKKIIDIEKHEIKGGIFASTIITILGIGFGAINVIGSIVTGTMNIKNAKEQKEMNTYKEPTYVNSVFTNSYSTSNY
ncbi:MAG: hypothetical protein ACRC4L_04110 [Mycoplasma sp.]